MWFDRPHPARAASPFNPRKASGACSRMWVGRPHVARATCPRTPPPPKKAPGACSKMCIGRPHLARATPPRNPRKASGAQAGVWVGRAHLRCLGVSVRTTGGGTGGPREMGPSSRRRATKDVDGHLWQSLTHPRFALATPNTPRADLSPLYRCWPT